MSKYKVSKNFKMNISFEELISFNKICKIDTQSTHHFETFSGILIYVSHPNDEEKFTIELGVDEDGIMYEGDYGCEDKFEEIPIEEGLKILSKYREIMVGKQDLECLLSCNKIDNNIVKITIK
ncbi:hypothetical protein G8S49_11310 [Clostridium botulinum C]|uniref:Uncharacterized protein n=2 Tax=Clostridium botulinum TaxID=1491 RepID=A0A9Q4TL46_CLOBO|nr:hypothetical protein [Clostridium botulinum]EGO86220.1 hypothetical protein CBCST_22930 [Clostridium botulinum C str. Stockholm]KEH99749.1 hypothetical protein Z952_p0073 [Clostridium botulinum C/D str. BKT75002]KEI05227.1 hypothetical protein Z954_0073 [Clostridium botulinum C/D str. BKT2873]MCD3195741.1 hypothetical protein [Clostridium botulinum C]MCD3201157.1 hypothetical protein [Clostridium botulinum C]